MGRLGDARRDKTQREEEEEDDRTRGTGSFIRTCSR